MYDLFEDILQLGSCLATVIAIPFSHCAWAFSLSLPPALDGDPGSNVYHQFLATVSIIPSNVPPDSCSIQFFDSNVYLFFINGDGDMPCLEPVCSHHMSDVVSALKLRGLFTAGLICPTQTDSDSLLYTAFFSIS